MLEYYLIITFPPARDNPGVFLHLKCYRAYNGSLNYTVTEGAMQDDTPMTIAERRTYLGRMRGRYL
ncbi:MAG: hypothetical protein ABI901_10455, partial [Roseiflexaceae bacterium]